MAKAPSNGTASSTTPWTGVSPEIATDLAIHLCRCRHRPVLFGGNSDNVQEAGAAGAAWLVVKATLDVLRGRNDLGTPNSTPSNLELSKLIGVSQTVFSGNLMKGWPGKTNSDQWLQKARKVFRHLLIGRDHQPADTEQERAARFIHEFFFRQSDEPPFLERARLRLSEPASVTETAHEITRLAFACERTKLPAWLVWVSGGTNFFSDLMMPIVGKATADAQKVGVRVAFVYASDACNSDAVNNLNTFEAKFGPVDSNCKYDLAKTKYENDSPINPHLLREFLHPTHRHLYLSIPGDNGSDDTLFTLRAQGVMRLPLAFQAGDFDLGEFQRWWNRIYHSTPRPAVEMPGTPAGT